MEKILLNKFRSKIQRNVNNSLTTQLKGSKKLLPQSSFFSTINEMDVYNNERENCNLIRLTCVVNPICSNVLFNTISEIVKNEGDPNAVKFLNYGMEKGYVSSSDFENKIYCKNADVFFKKGANDGLFVNEAIRDTQLSTEKCGFKYHCGIDIFNNHILRNNTFKTVCYSSFKLQNFNTINDWMRDENGNYIQGVGFGGAKLYKQHLYTTEDVDTYENTIDNKLFEKNGWFGFTNVGKFNVVDNNNEPMDIFRVINYRRSCDFIQMYPSSDLWSFTPKYNSYIHRLEKNWNYCLTYPSSSTTKNITFIRENTNSLKIMYFDDRSQLTNGLKAIKIYSICKHGLQKGDLINLYQNDTIILSACEVMEIEDEYIFSIFSSGLKISNLSYELTKADTDTSGVDDFLLTLPIQLQGGTYKITSTTATVNGSLFESPNLPSGITKSDFSVQIVNTETPIKTINFHGKTYKISIEDSKGISTIAEDELASANIMVNQSAFTFDINYVGNEGSDESPYQYEITNVCVNIPIQYIISSNRDMVYCGHGDDRVTYYLIDNKYVNLDDNAQDMSFKKVVDGEEVDYYVRIFSRLPNWKGCDVKIDHHQLYGTDKELITRYQTLENDFENHISQLSFAKNIYGDDISQVVYTDDIDISYLRDNLGRPLTSIYFTILKNNKGYKEWYGKNGLDISIRKHPQDNDKEYHIEYSHCFGMLNCAFRLSKESLSSIYHNNSMQLNNVDSSFQYQGLDVEDLQHSNLIYDTIYQQEVVDNEDDDDATKQRSYRSNFKEILNDEIQYGYYYDYDNNMKYFGDTHFYGDLCMYSKKRLVEESIQQVEMRFNTAQRELSSLDKSFPYFNTLCYDEILSDDKDQGGFTSTRYEVLAANQHKEGYCYYPHYEIPIKTFENYVTSQPSMAMTLVKIDTVVNEQLDILYKMQTLNQHNLQKNDVIYIKYDKINIRTNQVHSSEYYICYVTDIINNNIFECAVYDENHQRMQTLDTINVLVYRLFKKDSITPDYATFTKDGSCRFVWRKLISNGFDNENEVEHYPFLNGALYVTKKINLFVKRQDPNEYTYLQTGKFPNDITSNIIENSNKDNFVNENDMSC